MYDFYNDIRHHYIYAIVGNDGEPDDVVYVGKTCAKNPRYPFYAHTHGRVPATRGYFGPEGDCEDPQYYFLEILDCTGATAFKHVVAWYHYFEEKNFYTITSGLMADMSNLLIPETEKIYSTVCEPVTLEELFTRKLVDIIPPTTPAVPQKPKIGMTQMNMRISYDTADLFRDFCEIKGLSQNDAMAQLLSAAGMDFSGSVNSSLLDLQYQKQLVTQLRKEKEELQRKYVALHHKEIAYRKALTFFFKKIVKRFKDNARCSPVVHQPLKPAKYNLRRSPFYFYDYSYPADSGSSVISLAGLARGKSKEKHGALFLLATDENENSIKLRFYHKDDYIGINPTNESYSYKGARWIVSYVAAEDGAVDMIAGVPLELLGLSEIVINKSEPKGSERKKSLPFDDILSDAERRSKQQY